MATRRTHRSYLSRLPTLLLAIVLPFQASAIEPYKAVYSIEKYSSEIARTSYTLIEDDDLLHFKQHTRLTGFASLFRDDTVLESTDIDISGKDWLVDHYSYKQSGSKKPRDMDFNVRRHDGNSKAYGTYAGRTFDIDIEGTQVWDSLSVLLALRRDFDAATKQFAYDVIHKGALKRYVFKNAGRDNITVDGTEYAAYKLSRVHGRRITRIWVAPEMENRLVRIELSKDDELDTRMDLISYSRTTDADE